MKLCEHCGGYRDEWDGPRLCTPCAEDGADIEDRDCHASEPIDSES